MGHTIPEIDLGGILRGNVAQEILSGYERTGDRHMMRLLCEGYMSMVAPGLESVKQEWRYPDEQKERKH